MHRFLVVVALLLVASLGIAVGTMLDEQTAKADRPTGRAATLAVDVGQLSLDVDEQALEAEPAAAGVLEEVDLDSLVRAADDALRLPDDLEIAIRADPDEAFYDPAARQIVISPAFIAGVEEATGDLYESGDEALVAAASNVRFVVLHELGHALVDMLELPITGLEETAVDEFAAVAMLELLPDADPISVLEASDLFDVLAQAPEEADFYDEHALDQQRFFHLRCLVYGTDPDEYAEELEGLDLEEGRGDLCVDDSERVLRSWSSLLEPYLAG